MARAEGRQEAVESWVEQGRHHTEGKARLGAATPTSPGAHNSGPPVVLPSLPGSFLRKAGISTTEVE